MFSVRFRARFTVPIRWFQEEKWKGIVDGDAGPGRLLIIASELVLQAPTSSPLPSPRMHQISSFPTLFSATWSVRLADTSPTNAEVPFSGCQDIGRGIPVSQRIPFNKPKVAKNGQVP